MKLSASPQPTTKKKEFIPQYFSPSKSTIREYSISYAGSPGSSSEIDQINEYIPISNENSSNEIRKISHDNEENTFLSSNSRSSPSKKSKIMKSESAYKIPKNSSNDSTTNKKCQDLIKNSPIDKFMNFNDFIGKDMDKFLYISENDKKPVVKDPLSSRIYPISKNDFGLKGSLQEVNNKSTLYKGDSKKNLQFEEKKKMFSMSNLPNSNNNIQTIVKKKQENNNSTPKQRPKTPIKYDNYQNSKLNQEPYAHIAKSNYSSQSKENEKESNVSQLLNPSPKIKKPNGLISPENKDKISLDFLFFNKSKPQKALSPSKYISADNYGNQDFNKRKHTKSFFSEINDNQEKLSPPTFKKSFDISHNQEQKKEKGVADFSPKLIKNYNNSFHNTQENSKKVHENLNQNKNDEINNNNNNNNASKSIKNPNDLPISKKTERSVSQYTTPIFKDEAIKSNETGRYNEKNIPLFEYSSNIIKKGVNVEVKTNEHAEPFILGVAQTDRSGGKKSMNLSDKILNSEKDALKQKAFDIFRPKSPGLSYNVKLGDFSMKNSKPKIDINQNNASFRQENEKNKNSDMQQLSLKTTQIVQIPKVDEKKQTDPIENEANSKKSEKSVSQVLYKNYLKENENETKEKLENSKTPLIISREKEKQSDIQNLPLSRSLKSLKSLDLTKEIDLPIVKKSTEIEIKKELPKNNHNESLAKKLKSVELPDKDNNEDDSLKDTLPLNEMLPKTEKINENYDSLDQTLEKTFINKNSETKKQEDNNSNIKEANEKPRGKSAIIENNIKERRSISQSQKTDNFSIKVISPEEENDSKKQVDSKKKSIKNHKKSEDINVSGTLKPLSNSIKKVSFTTNSSNETENSTEKISAKKPSLRSKNSLTEEDLCEKKQIKNENISNELEKTQPKTNIKISGPAEDSSNKQVRRTSKKNKKKIDEKKLENNEEILDKVLKGSKTTRNQELIQIPNEQKFNMSPTSRAKSVCRNGKERDESKMDFLNLNEFISTLGRG